MILQIESLQMLRLMTSDVMHKINLQTLVCHKFKSSKLLSEAKEIKNIFVSQETQEMTHIFVFMFDYFHVFLKIRKMTSKQEIINSMLIKMRFLK